MDLVDLIFKDWQFLLVQLEQPLKVLEHYFHPESLFELLQLIVYRLKFPNLDKLAEDILELEGILQYQHHLVKLPFHMVLVSNFHLLGHP